MKTITRVTIPLLLLCLVPAAAFAAKPAAKAPAEMRPTITLHATASVSDTYFTLGEVADIKGAGQDLAARLAAAPMGRSPLAGTARPLNQGDIALKLRQAGIDPASVTIAGASTALITCTGGGSSAATGGGAAPAAGSPDADSADMVHSGDAVNLVYVDGRITISARAFALQSGAPGATILLRRDGVAHTLLGTVIDAQTVQLED